MFGEGGFATVEHRGPTTLVLSADLLAVRAIGPWLRSVLSVDPATDVDTALPTIELAVHELAVNTVQHGYRNPAGQIRLSARRLTGAWEVTMVDNASAFDPRPVPAPTSVQEHGYGLMIVRQLATSFDHRRQGDENITTLTFSVPPPPAPVTRRAGPPPPRASRCGPGATIIVSGRLDVLTAPELRRRLNDLIDNEVSSIVVDLSEVEQVDSSGLAALVAGMKACRDRNGDVVLIRPRLDGAYRVFALTKFDAVFTILDPRS